MEPSRDACARLAATADHLAADDPPPRVFVRRLASEAAGIRTGPWLLLDLLRAGRNPITGHGFRPELEDGSPYQARHFAGVARAVTLLGGRVTRWLSETVRLDPRGTPDGRLTDLAQDFARGVLDGRIAVSDAGDWIRAHVCASAPDGVDA